MKFDKSRVYTAVNADELKVGSTVIVADTLAALKKNVERSDMVPAYTVTYILAENNTHRFVTGSVEWALAYLVSEPEKKKLKWTDLKIGDVVRNIHSGIEYLVTGLDKRADGYNVNVGSTWVDTNVLEMNWEKVEE